MRSYFTTTILLQKQHLFVFCAILFLASCKVSQKSTPQPFASSEVVSDSINKRVAIKPVYVTALGDTLVSLHEEVEIRIDRLLPDTLTLAAVGDIMMGTNYPNASYLPANKGEDLWIDCKEELTQADITFGNLEGTLFNGEGTPKKCQNPKACYLFRSPTDLAPNLTACGFDLLSLANNHANDFGKSGRSMTQQVLDSLGIYTAGSIENPYGIYKMHGLKIGFVAFAPNKGTLTFYDEQKAFSIIQKLDSLCDIVLVSIHGGAEGSKNMHVTKKREFYYGEDRGNIHAFSHRAIDKGADLIIGHGPHVPRAVEVYNQKLIVYSLGNFCTYGRFNLKGANAEAPLLNINLSNTGSFLSGEIIAYRQSYSYGPRRDPSNRVVRTMKKLSEEDFPENEISIDDNGRIIYIQN